MHYLHPINRIESSNLISVHQHHRKTIKKNANEIKFGMFGRPYEKLHSLILQYHQKGSFRKATMQVSVS